MYLDGWVGRLFLQRDDRIPREKVMMGKVAGANVVIVRSQRRKRKERSPPAIPKLGRLDKLGIKTNTHSLFPACLQFLGKAAWRRFSICKLYPSFSFSSTSSRPQKVRERRFENLFTAFNLLLLEYWVFRAALENKLRERWFEPFLDSPRTSCPLEYLQTALEKKLSRKTGWNRVVFQLVSLIERQSSAKPSSK